LGGGKIGVIRDNQRHYSAWRIRITEGDRVVVCCFAKVAIPKKLKSYSCNMGLNSKIIIALMGLLIGFAMVF